MCVVRSLQHPGWKITINTQHKNLNARSLFDQATAATKRGDETEDELQTVQQCRRRSRCSLICDYVRRDVDISGKICQQYNAGVCIWLVSTCTRSNQPEGCGVSQATHCWPTGHLGQKKRKMRSWQRYSSRNITKGGIFYFPAAPYAGERQVNAHTNSSKAGIN